MCVGCPEQTNEALHPLTHNTAASMRGLRETKLTATSAVIEPENVIEAEPAPVLVGKEAENLAEFHRML